MVCLVHATRVSEEKHQRVEWYAQSHAIPKVLLSALETLSFLLHPDVTVMEDHQAWYYILRASCDLHFVPFSCHGPLCCP